MNLNDKISGPGMFNTMYIPIPTVAEGQDFDPRPIKIWKIHYNFKCLAYNVRKVYNIAAAPIIIYVRCPVT